MKIIHPSDDIVIVIDSVPLFEGLAARKREREAVSELLSKTLGNVELRHNEAGKPFIDGWNISISHSINRSGGYVAIIYSKNHNVGIDIEYRSDRIMKIANRFLRDDEHPQTVENNLICWCAKEAVYKLFSAEDLTYQQMKVSQDLSKVENLKQNVSVDIHSIKTPEYILVWTKENR